MISISKLLVANRGEIARRIFRTCRQLGISTVAVYSDADRDALFVREADEAVHIGASNPADSYLQGEIIIAAAKSTGVDAIHPGYGFLAENAYFASAVRSSGLIFVGPKASSIEAMGLKHRARQLAVQNNVPVVPGVILSGDETALDVARAWAEEHGFPALLKASAGGGGKGMRRANSFEELDSAFSAALGEAKRAFGNTEMLIERYLNHSRHVEIQILGDQHGQIMTLGARDCSIQRRHQKLIEETPPPNLPKQLINNMSDAALRLAKAVDYEGAGTVEFIVSKSGDEWDYHFLEMNTRLQVEHPITEIRFGIDLVAAQLQIAEGASLKSIKFDCSNLFVMEARVCAEDVNFVPQVGTIELWSEPTDTFVRIDSGVTSGSVVSAFYDSMLAKVIAFGDSRDEARMRLRGALKSLFIAGIQTNVNSLLETLELCDFRLGHVKTSLINEISKTPNKSLNWIDFIVCARLAEIEDNKKGQHWHPRFSNMPFWDVWETWEVCGQRLESRESRASNWSIEFKGGPTISASNEPCNSLFCFSSDTMERKLRADVLWHGDSATVKIAGVTQIVRRLPRFSSTASTTTDTTICAPMPGRILRVEIEEGQHVTKGQTLLVLEAMKMEQNLVSPRDGVVSALTCAANDQVKADQLLISFETPNNETT